MLNPFSWSLDNWFLFLQILAFLTLGVTVAVGYFLSTRQVREMLELKTELADAKTKQAEAEIELAKLKSPRWARLGPLTEYVKGKPAGTVEIVFIPENDEAQKTALWLEGILSADGKWTILKNAHPYSDTDILPRFLTPAFKDNPFHQSLFERVGGLSDITVLGSSADFNREPTFTPKGGTAVEVLWRGLHRCGFETIATVSESLPAGTARIVVGPKP